MNKPLIKNKKSKFVKNEIDYAHKLHYKNYKEIIYPSY